MLFKKNLSTAAQIARRELIGNVEKTNQYLILLTTPPEKNYDAVRCLVVDLLEMHLKLEGKVIVFILCTSQSKTCFPIIIFFSRIAYGVSGAVATLLHDGIMTPAEGIYSKLSNPILGRQDLKFQNNVKQLLRVATANWFTRVLFFILVVKQRMQMCCSPYKSCWECARSAIID